VGENTMSNRKYRITVYYYPFETNFSSLPYETELEAFNKLTDRVFSADEIVREKLLKDPQVSEVVKAVDEINAKYWSRMNEVLLACVELYLSEEEWKKFISETIKAYKTRIKILEEHLKKLEDG
jgi:hypothetical protein